MEVEHFEHEGVGQQPIVEEQIPPMSDAPAYHSAVPPPFAHSIISREEKVEYRDQNGNLLDEEQVKALEGKVSFKTRYETRTRMVDGAGNVVNPEEINVAPPHPDVDNVDPDTVGLPDVEFEAAPASQRDVREDELKEEAVENSKRGEAEPTEDVPEATA